MITERNPDILRRANTKANKRQIWVKKITSRVHIKCLHSAFSKTLVAIITFSMRQLKNALNVFFAMNHDNQNSHHHQPIAVHCWT